MNLPAQLFFFATQLYAPNISVLHPSQGHGRFIFPVIHCNIINICRFLWYCFAQNIVSFNKALLPAIWCSKSFSLFCDKVLVFFLNIGLLIHVHVLIFLVLASGNHFHVNLIMSLFLDNSKHWCFLVPETLFSKPTIYSSFLLQMNWIRGFPTPNSSASFQLEIPF